MPLGGYRGAGKKRLTKAKTLKVSRFLIEPCTVYPVYKVCASDVAE